jgi:hypothetical protein
MMHSMWEALPLFPLSPAAAMEELSEPNLEYVETNLLCCFAESKRANLESDSEQDAERTSLHGVTPHAETASDHMEKITTSTKRSTL